MSIDGPRSVCPVLGHLGGGVVPATRGQVLRSQEVLFNGPGGMCVFLCAKKKKTKPEVSCKDNVGFPARNYIFTSGFYIKRKNAEL